MKELWLPVYGLEDQYLVSNVGRVQCRQTGNIRRMYALDGRYVAVAMNQKIRKVHHLVAEAFIGPRPEGMLCLHRDDDKLNNTPENLYWGTQKQNQQDCIKNGHRPSQSGEANHNAKLDEDAVRAIRAAQGTCKAIGKQYGVSPMTVSLIKRGKLWSQCN